MHAYTRIHVHPRIRKHTHIRARRLAQRVHLQNTSMSPSLSASRTMNVLMSSACAVITFIAVSNAYSPTPSRLDTHTSITVPEVVWTSAMSSTSPATVAMPRCTRTHAAHSSSTLTNTGIASCYHPLAMFASAYRRHPCPLLPQPACEQPTCR